MIIASRYNGPPGSGNGGYSAGRFAAASGISADALEVTLRKPPPLEVELLARGGDEPVGLWAGEELVAEVRPTTPPEVPDAPPVSWDEAVQASTRYPGFTAHPFPTCFVCGPDRAEGDGLRLFPGRLADGRTATPFLVPAQIAPELVWASLDCPGGWVIPLEGRPYVLGRFAVTVLDLPRPGEHCVVMGAMTGEDGRKAFVSTALYAEGGQPLAAGRATWVAL